MELQLLYDVATHDGRLLAPAGSDVDDGLIEAVAAAGRTASSRDVPLLQYGTVARDLEQQMQTGRYALIFRGSKSFGDLCALMEPVRLPEPVLEGLQYFRGNDYYTYRHILMVFAFSCFLARDLLTESERVLPEAAAGPLHDLGKICVPLGILRKKSPLTRLERRMLEQHTLAGYLLLAHYIPDYSFGAQVARDHHERRDGSGYPRGIRLSDRHVEIISACDVYDALITPRPYRAEGYENRAALEVLTSLAEEGKISWDIVRCLVAMNREGHPEPEAVQVSLEKRGKSPEGNVYGLFEEERAPGPDGA